MKKQLLTLATSLLALNSCVVRDNTMDINGDSYEKPAIESTTGFSDTTTVLSDQFIYNAEGNSEHTLYRYNLDGTGWSDWAEGSFTIDLDDGYHTLETELCYPSMIDTARETIQFISLTEENSFYLSPASIPVDQNSVTVSSFSLTGEAATMHIELSEGTVTAAALLGDTSFTELLFADNTLDIAVFPGGTPITESRDIVQFSVSGLESSDTLHYTAHLETSTGDTITINNTLGTIVE